MKKVAGVQDTRQVQVGGTQGEQTGTTQVQQESAPASLLTTVRLLQQRCLLAELCACVWCKAITHIHGNAHHILQVHMCVNDCCRFPHLEAHEYRQHVDDACPHCQQKRFELKQTAAGVRVLPRKVMYYFGVAAVIRDRMFTDPSFCKHRCVKATSELCIVSHISTKLQAC